MDPVLTWCQGLFSPPFKINLSAKKLYINQNLSSILILYTVITCFFHRKIENSET
jgi:hypothetical protein